MFRIGYISKLHGFKGELTLNWQVSRPADYLHLRSLSLVKDEHTREFKVEEVAPKTAQTAKIRLAGIESEEAARQWIGAALWIENSQMAAHDATRLENMKMTGYAVYDEVLGALGHVADVIPVQANPQLVIQRGEEEFLLPAQPAFIIGLDHEQKIIHTRIPTGLIELNRPSNQEEEEGLQ